MACTDKLNSVTMLQVVADKASYALRKGLSVVLCVGETLDEREANKAEEVCSDTSLCHCVTASVSSLFTAQEV